MESNSVVIRHNPEAEQGVIGCCLYDNKFMARVSSILKPEYFYDPRRQRIFAVMLELWEAGKEFDLIIVSDILKNRKKAVSLTDWEETVSCSVIATGLFVNRYHYVVRDAWLYRQTIAKLEEAKVNLSEDGGDPSVSLTNIIDAMMMLKQEISEKTLIHRADELTEQNLKNVVERIDNYKTDKATGVPTGIDELDHAISGFRAGQMIVVAGRPSLGKTDLGLNFAVNAALRGYPSLFVSLEMSAEDVWVRVSSLFTNIYRYKHFTGELSEFEFKLLSQSTSRLSELPIIVADMPGMKLIDIRAATIEAKHQIDIKLLIVDYVGLISTVGKNITREQEIAKISAGLKLIARELNIPVIAISQLNRAVENRNPPIPRLSDLRDSGALEQDADIVILLYRASYYDKKALDDNLQLDIAKCRNGLTEVIDDVPYDRGIGKIGEIVKIKEDKIPF